MTDNDNLNPEQAPPVPSGRNNNAWLVRLGEEARLNGYVLTIDFGSSSLRGIQTEDAMLITEERDGKYTVIGVGRAFRRRYSLEDTSFYFNGYLPATPNATLDLTTPADGHAEEIIDMSDKESCLVGNPAPMHRNIKLQTQENMQYDN